MRVCVHACVGTYKRAHMTQDLHTSMRTHVGNSSISLQRHSAMYCKHTPGSVLYQYIS